MTGGYFFFQQIVLFLFGQAQKTQCIGHGSAADAQRGCQGFVGQTELVNEHLVGGGFFQVVQILPLQVFDKGNGQHFLVAVRPNNGRYALQPCHGGGAPAAFACNNHIHPSAAVYHNQRL